ncbi:MAG: substrate-binding domain-containing protein, partial [Proteobacteria bacterium]|nr:substrate-binding domain-containing protein [Pseudomonadota bacterium]
MISFLRNRIAFTLLSLLILLNWAHNSFARNSSNLTIFSEANMVYALTEITRTYAKQDNVVVSVDFNSSFELIQNIDFGEPADVFISSHSDWIEILKQKGLVDVYNLINIAKDKLVIITSNKNEAIDTAQIDGTEGVEQILKMINDKKLPLIIESEYSSLGRYTQEIMKKVSIENHRTFNKIPEDKKSIINLINENNSYCG